MSMTREEASKKISALVQNAYDSIHQAEALADEHGISFSFSPEYGMGGYYDPEEINDSTGNHWYPSSLGC